MEQTKTSANASVPGVCTPKATPELLLVLIPCILIILAVVIGNVLVIAAVLTTRRLRLPCNFYLVSLATVDLSVGLFILPFNIINQVKGCWVYGKVWCKLFVVFDVTLCTASILHLCTIALDRYRSVTGGVEYIKSRTLKHVVSSVICIWILSIWIGSPPLLGWNETWLQDFDRNRECMLMIHWGYVVYTAVGSFIFPLVVLCAVYYQIYCAIQKRFRMRARLSGLVDGKIVGTGGETSTNTDTNYATDTDDMSLEDQLEDGEDGKQKKRTLPKPKLTRRKSLSNAVKSFLASKRKFSLQKERNAAKTLGIIMGAFISSWIPFMMMYIMLPFLDEKYWPSPTVFEFLTWLGYCNSAANPIIYTVFSMEFRKAFKRLLGFSREKIPIRTSVKNTARKAESVKFNDKVDGLDKNCNI